MTRTLEGALFDPVHFSHHHWALPSSLTTLFRREDRAAEKRTLAAWEHRTLPILLRDKSFNVLVESLYLLSCHPIIYALFDRIKIYVCVYDVILECIMQVGRSELKEGDDGKGHDREEKPLLPSRY